MARVVRGFNEGCTGCLEDLSDVARYAADTQRLGQRRLCDLMFRRTGVLEHSNDVVWSVCCDPKTVERQWMWDVRFVLANGCRTRDCGFLNDVAGAVRWTLQISYGTFLG